MPDKKKKDLQNNIDSDFVNLASHQLRTPLSGMKWMLEILQKKSTGPLTKKQKDFIERIYFANERMIGLVNDLLEVSRIEQGSTKLYLQPTDLDHIIRSLLRGKEKEIDRKRLHVTFTVEQEPFPVVRTEPSKIKQALNNLISNAITYTPEDGKVKIELKLKDKDPNTLECSITDTGMGILKEQESQIFDKFFRGTNVSKVESVGSGLGLYIAKAFIEASGGKIWFKSNIGQGTTFSFNLPLIRTKQS
jgi:signal transduction histidine kinase